MASLLQVKFNHSFKNTVQLHPFIAESDFNDTSYYEVAFIAPIVTVQNCINVTIRDDSILEPNETLQLVISSTSEYVQFVVSVLNVTILDDDCKCVSYSL